MCLTRKRLGAVCPNPARFETVVYAGVDRGSLAREPFSMFTSESVSH